MPSCVLCGIFIQTTEFDIPCSHSSEEISSAVNEPSQDFNNAQRRLLSLSQLDKNLLIHYDHKANILKAVKKEKYGPSLYTVKLCEVSLTALQIIGEDRRPQPSNQYERDYELEF